MRDLDAIAKHEAAHVVVGLVLGLKLWKATAQPAILNGERVQNSNTADMIFDVPAIIEYLSGSTTLVPGTVILTGTPQGVGMATKPLPRWLRPGDSCTIEIEKIGALTNPVALELV